MKRLVLSLVILAIFVGSALLSIAFFVERNCDARDSTIPEAPIYPASVLAKETTSDADFGGQHWYKYEVDAPFAMVTNFYMANTGCSVDDKGASCFGFHRGKPFGTYAVDIIYNSATKTTYSIDISWDKCTPYWHKSIE